MKKEKHNKIKLNMPPLLLAVRIICAIQLAVAVGGLAYVSFLHLLPIKYLVIMAVVIILITALHIIFIETKTNRKILKIISIVLSVVVILVAIFGASLVGTFHGSVNNIYEENGEVSAIRKDVANESFIIYLSGLDTRNTGQIAEKGLSDVNMVIAVNPETNKIIMVNIPRDYYVPLEGDSNKMDKLTHAGNYGVSCSISTLENLFDITCNYYVKVNFKSVVDIVDALGGVTVDSDFSFSSTHSLSGKTYSFKVGENRLTGDAALAFARERYSFSNGDRQRGIHQQKVIRAIFDKAISPSMLNPAKIGNVLEAITNNTKTNISSNEISKLIRMQLNDMPSWDIQTISVDGTGAARPTYSAGSQKLSVMIPNQETVDAAKLQIKAVLEN